MLLGDLFAANNELFEETIDRGECAAAKIGRECDLMQGLWRQRNVRCC
jgi:hypothetical protein